jgi:hypothetical protein
MYVNMKYKVYAPHCTSEKEINKISNRYVRSDEWKIGTSTAESQKDHYERTWFKFENPSGDFGGLEQETFTLEKPGWNSIRSRRFSLRL